MAVKILPEATITLTPSRSAIEDYIKSKSWNYTEAYSIFMCESGLNPKAYNPETRAKELGITKYSSYGIAQINAPLDERLYDYKFNIDEAFKKWSVKKNWSPWKNCRDKLGIIY